MTAIPRIVVGGTQSGVGKTSICLGLARAFARRGLRVQTFKVGPDFLDPTWLARASGRPCYNLDGWMAGVPYVRSLFTSRAADADLAIVEGVMGLFDGVGPADSSGSTAEAASMLEAPVVLVFGARGLGRSVGAMVSGYAGFEPGVRLGGVIANLCGSSAHGHLLEEALSDARGRYPRVPPLAGAVRRDALPVLPSRHLGLLTADDATAGDGLFEALADGVERHVNLDALLEMARDVAPMAMSDEAGGLPEAGDGQGSPTIPAASASSSPRPDRVRIGIALDAAFHFYYADDLEGLRAAGADLVPFSPLADPDLPADLAALWVGGGYPEDHAARLSANTSMRDAVRRFGERGGPIYAECGGLMYLARHLRTRTGEVFPMVGLLPGGTEMHASRRALGYVEVTLAQDGLWGARGDVLRGHEFHYSDWVGDAQAAGWRPAYSLVKGRDPSGEPVEAGFSWANVLASYVHLHHASRPDTIRRFLQVCGGTC